MECRNLGFAAWFFGRHEKAGLSVVRGSSRPGCDDEREQESVQHGSGVINYRNSTKRLVAFAKRWLRVVRSAQRGSRGLGDSMSGTGVGGALDIVINTDSGESLGAVRKLRHKRTQELRLQSAI